MSFASAVFALSSFVDIPDLNDVRDRNGAPVFHKLPTFIVLGESCGHERTFLSNHDQTSIRDVQLAAIAHMNAKWFKWTILKSIE